MQDSQQLVKKIHNYDNALRVFGLSVLLLLIIINLVAIQRINQLGTNNAKNIADHRYQVETLDKARANQLATAATANRARLDVGLCIFSVSPTRRTPEYVKSCYDRIEKEQGIKVERFGDGE